MSYLGLGHYRTRGMAALGATEPQFYVYVQKWRGYGKSSSSSGPSASSAKKDGPPIKKGPYGKVEAEQKKNEANIGIGGWKQYKGPRDGAYHWTTAMVVPIVTATVGAPQPTGPSSVIGMLVRQPQPMVNGGSGPQTSQQSGGGGGGGGDGPQGPPAASQEVETENVAVTEQGPVLATVTGKPLAPGQEGMPTTTLLVIGGGLLAAYLLFGRKRA